MTDTAQTTTTAPPGEPPRRSRWRWLAPALVVLIGFFVVLPVAGTLSGKLSSVTENDQAAFLPDSAESTRSLELETRFAGAQDIPALIVWDERDELLGRDQQEQLADAIPGSRLVTYRDAGHLVLWDQPEQIARDLTSFVAGLTKRPL